MGRTKTKFTTSEIYIQIYKNVENLIQNETDWLNSKDCRAIEPQKRKISDLEATLRILRSCPGICYDFTTI
jgi:hypothetical protein